MSMKQNILYRIYYGHKLVYVGVTNFDLTNTLRVNFFGTNNLDITRVSKVEYSILSSMADCLVYQAFYVNSHKPLCNKSGKARDELSANLAAVLPDLTFEEYDNEVITKWERMASDNQINLFENFQAEMR